MLHGRAPRNAEAELEQRRIVDQAFGAKLLGEPEIAGIEDLHLRLDAIGLDEPGLFAQLRRRLHDDGVAVAEIERAAIERADFRAQLGDMEEPLDRADEIGACASLNFIGLFAGADLEIAAHAGGEVDDDVLVLGADALDDFAIEMDAAGALAGLGIAHMAMDDRRACSGRFQRRIGDLLRRDGKFGLLPTVSPAPVTAQVMMILGFMGSPFGK